MTSKVLGIAASRPTRVIRPATGQRSIGSMVPNQAARRTTWIQLKAPMIPKCASRWTRSMLWYVPKGPSTASTSATPRTGRS